MPDRTAPAPRAGSPGPRRALRSCAATLRSESRAIRVAEIRTGSCPAAGWRPAAVAGAAVPQAHRPAADASTRAPAAGQAGGAAGCEIALVSHVTVPPLFGLEDGRRAAPASWG